MLLLCHPRLTTTNLSYGFPLLETWATTLCGTTGTFLHTLSSFLACARLRGIYNVCACIWLAIAISYVNRGLFWYYRSWRVCWRCNIFVVDVRIAMVGLLGTVVESWNRSPFKRSLALQGCLKLRGPATRLDMEMVLSVARPCGECFQFFCNIAANVTHVWCYLVIWVLSAVLFWVNCEHDFLASC